MLDRGVLINSTNVLLQTHGEQLRELLGRTITNTWVPWETKSDEWFADEAVILGIEDSKLEPVFMYLDSLALTWNQIDLSSSPKWVSDWGNSFNLRWSSSSHTDLKKAIGKTIRRISVIEYFNELTMVEDRRRPENVGQKLANWFLHGLEFDFDDACLVIYNDLDKAVISSEPFLSSKFRKVEVN